MTGLAAHDLRRGTAVRGLRLGGVLCLGGALAATGLAAQQGEHAGSYAFAERPPVTRVERVIDQRLPSIVKIHGASGLATITPFASGIVVSERGHILTIDQIMLQAEQTRVVLHDGSVHRARLLPPEERLGVRLLQIDASAVASPLVPLWPAPAQEVAVRSGQFIVSLGNCFRLAEFSEKVSATFGVVAGIVNTALRYRMTDVAYEGDIILTDASNNPGHYGGGLFTLDGRWIGINMKLLDSKETNTMLSAAIPVSDLLPYLAEHVLGEQRATVEIGMAPVWTGVVLFEQAGRRSPPAYVERVEKDSPAAQLGLRVDDLIVRVDDFPIRSCVEWRSVLARFRPGQTVRLMWKRGTKVMTGDLSLAEERRQ